jgi:hypothetical protein
MGSIHETMMKLVGNPKFLVAAVGSLGGANVAYRLSSSAKGDDQFAKHTREQHVQLGRFISGMHSPFFAEREADDREFSDKHFADYKRLINLTAENFEAQTTLRTPVAVLPLARCSMSSAELQVHNHPHPPLPSPCLLSSYTMMIQ